MKIKIWVLVIIIAGSMAIGGTAMFAAMNGFVLAGRLLQDVRLLHAGINTNIQNGGNQAENRLPTGFNAGVSVESVYTQMTGQTVEQVQAAEQSAGTDIWGLAQKDGKLDELKTKVLAAVTSSLDKMVSDGKITKNQRDSYLSYVNKMLQNVGKGNANGYPGGGRGFSGGFGRHGQIAPGATATPGIAS